MCAARRWTRWPLLRIAARNRGIASLEAAAQTRRAWMAWWSGYGRRAKIYGPEDCAAYFLGQ